MFHPRLGRVIVKPSGIGGETSWRSAQRQIIHPCIRFKIINVRENRRLGVKKGLIGEIVKITSMLGITCGNEIFPAQILVVHVREVNQAEITKYIVWAR